VILHDQNMEIPALEEFAVFVEPWVFQGHPHQPMLESSLSGQLPRQHWPVAGTSYLCLLGCKRNFVRLGDYKRHWNTVHVNRSRFRCHFRRCPRSIKGHGFPRRDKLVDHLKSKKHDLSHKDAVHEAALHHPDRGYYPVTSELIAYGGPR
jgi:hypothetical protein